MKSRLSSLPLVALGLALSACGGGGGGGGGSRPNPTPAPTPSPTPTPTPTPTPPPSSANADLLQPLASERFDNRAKLATGNYTDTSSSLSAGAATLTFDYDAASDTYSVASGGRAASFGPGDLDPDVDPSERAVLYSRDNADGSTDALYLTTNSDEAGTRTAPEFQYVGGGMWQRVAATTSTLDVSILPFAYGVETPTASVPTTGSAVYYTRVEGVGLYPDTISSLVGGGQFEVDFAAANFQGEGVLQETSVEGVSMGEMAWYGAASLSSNKTFSGGFAVLPTYLSPAGMLSNGQLSGMFFGPAAEELGASWTYRDPSTGVVYTGFALGKDGRLLPGSDTLRALFASVDLSELGWQWDGWKNLPGGQISLNSYINNVAHARIRYDATVGALVLEPFGPIPATSLSASNYQASESDATYEVYRSAERNDGGAEHRFRVEMLRSSDDNPLIALTYTGFLRYTIEADRIATQSDYWEGTLAFGLETPAEAVPTGGSANFQGIVAGQSAQMLDATGTVAIDPMTISGSAFFNFDFAAALLGGYMDLNAQTRDGAQSFALGRYNFVDGSVIVGTNGFNANFDQYIGRGSGLYGRFTGPGAEELYAQWSTGMTNPFYGGDVDIWGIIVAARGE